MISTTKLAVGVAALVAGGGLALGAASVASADPSAPPSGGSSASTSGKPSGAPTGNPGGQRQKGTEVTGDEATKVSNAVTAKDAAVKVEKVVKLADGSYRVKGTKDSARVTYTVSADLATVAQAPEGPKGGAKGTEVTGDEATKVSNAVTAKDSGVKVEKVVKLADGSYRVMGTKDSARVAYTVSADLATVTQAAEPTGRGGKGGAQHQHTDATAEETAKVTAAVKAKDAAVTVEKVVKDPDGSFDAEGTKDGKKVKVEVSADLQTIEVRTGR